MRAVLVMLTRMLEKIGELIGGAEKYFIQAFKDSGDIIGENFTAPDLSVLREMKSQALKFAKNCEIRGV